MTSDDDLSNIEFVYDDSYDMIVYNNYITESPKDYSESIIFFHEPSWVGNHQKTFNNVDNITVFGFNKNNYDSIGKVIELPSHMFYGGRGPWCEGWDFWSYDNLINYTFNKTKKISSVVSTIGSENKDYPDGCLYIDRFRLIDNLSKKIDFVDFFGWEGNLPHFMGGLTEKKDGIVDYKFSICIENANEINYISEKFYDCILTNTIPIYYGCKNIKDIWPENGYFLINDIKNVSEVESLLLYINNNIDLLYDTMLPELLKMKERYFSDFNLLKKINNFSKQIFLDNITKKCNLDHNDSISTYGGWGAQQNYNSFRVFHDFLMKTKPKRILEIGTSIGGFTSFLKYTSDRLGINCDILSYDINELGWYDEIRLMGITLKIENVFDSNYSEVKQEVIDFIQSEGTTIVLCDGGNKIGEFNLLSKYIKNGDYILAHDYAPNVDIFNQHIKGVIWNWHEIQDSDIIDSCIENGLSPYMTSDFNKVVWVCKQKI
jgi:hypothetical protein